MTKAIVIEKTGGPEVMEYKDVEVGQPSVDEVKIRNTCIGLNFIDTYHRSGLYPLPLPSGLGLEASAVVESVGSNVLDFKEGDRVAYAGGPPGSYSQERLIPYHRLVKIPDGVEDEKAAAMMLKGLTAWYLLRKTYNIKAGNVVLFHAAAGGVGLIACQWLKFLGATVIGTVGSDEKAKLAAENGCDHTIIYTRENFVEKVLEITNGKKVDVVYDSVGKDTFLGSLDCLKPRGLLAVFGNGSGPVDTFDLNNLASKGSLFVTRPTLMTYVAERSDLLEGANELMSMVSSGTLNISINQRYDLADVEKAHDDLESRKTTGSTILIP